MPPASPQTVAVLGANADPESYSNLAVQMLLEHGHRVVPVHPALTEVLGQPVASSLDKISPSVDTLTLYIRPERLEKIVDAIVALRPGRVIFNPGTESTVVQTALTTAGIPWVNACTLVLLRTGQF